jgi:hypothetical protein
MTPFASDRSRRDPPMRDVSDCGALIDRLLLVRGSDNAELGTSDGNLAIRGPNRAVATRSEWRSPQVRVTRMRTILVPRKV